MQENFIQTKESKESFEYWRRIKEKEDKLASMPKGAEADAFREEIFRDRISYTLVAINKTLARVWGIENLSTLEAYHLMKVVEDGLRQYDREMAMLNNGEITGQSVTPDNEDSAWMSAKQKEFIARWLDKMYNMRDINVEDRTGKISKEIKEYIARQRERAHAEDREA